jgi:hypothetical protein
VEDTELVTLVDELADAESDLDDADSFDCTELPVDEAPFVCIASSRDDFTEGESAFNAVSCISHRKKVVDAL